MWVSLQQARPSDRDRSINDHALPFPSVVSTAMITYLVLTPAWMYISWGSLAPQPNKSEATTRDKVDLTTENARKSRRNTACAFFASIVGTLTYS